MTRQKIKNSIFDVEVFIVRYFFIYLKTHFESFIPLFCPPKSFEHFVVPYRNYKKEIGFFELEPKNIPFTHIAP